MIGALNTAFAGLRHFAAQAERAAHTITGAGLAAHGAAHDAAPDGGPANAEPNAMPRPAGPALEAPDLAGGIVALKQAEIGYKASARLAARLTDMQRTVMDILR